MGIHFLARVTAQHGSDGGYVNKYTDAKYIHQLREMTWSE